MRTWIRPPESVAGRDPRRSGSRCLCAAGAVALFAPAAWGADGASSAPEPGASPRAWARHTPVPILVYHHAQGYLAGNYLMYVGTSQFASQHWYLHHHGYHPVTMQQVWDDWTGKADLPRRPVVLSFDDGYPDQYSNAARQLRRYHWPAVLNLVVHRGTSSTRSSMCRWTFSATRAGCTTAG